VALLALVALLAPRAPHARAQVIPHLSITVMRAEAVSLSTLGDPDHDELFVRTLVQYSGTDVFHLSAGDFELAGTDNVAMRPLSYQGSSPLDTTDFVGPGTTKGWLLFKVKVGSTSKTLTLGYVSTETTAPGIQQKMLLGQSKPFGFPASPDPTRSYAAAVQTELDTYLLDEARAAGYMREHVEPLYAQGSGTAIPAATRAQIAAFRRLLAGDQHAFDAVAAAPAARSLKTQADTAFAAIDHDLQTLLPIRRAADWLAWSALFSTDDHALADLYQDWPGPQ
jgi:hypothetical protein